MEIGMKLSSKDWQYLLLAFLDARGGGPCEAGPDDLSAWGVVTTDPKTGIPYLPAPATNTNTKNGALNPLVKKGIVYHPAGNKLVWQRTNISAEAESVLCMPQKEKKKMVEERWSVTSLGRSLLNDITDFDKLHKNSPFFNRDMQFPNGTADTILPAGAPAWLAQESHIIDKFITKTIGRVSWDKSPNVILEHETVNQGRYRRAISTKVTPEGLVYQVQDGVDLGLRVDLDGKLMKALPEYLLGYRTAFLLRGRLVAMLASDTLLKEVMDTLRKIEDSEVESEAE